MGPCLVQQLFRQKIGQELDVALFDEVIFPLLFKQKYLPYSLHLDIRMVQNITIYPLIMGYIAPANRPHMVPGKVQPFDAACFGRTHLGMLRSCGQEDRLTKGRHGSKFRRKKTHKRNWGSVDILNELRSLKHHQMGYEPTDQGYELGEECDLFSEFDDEFGNAFLRLDTIPDISCYWRIEKEKSLRLRGKFVPTRFRRSAPSVCSLNGFLDYLIKNGYHTSWGGNPRCEFQPVLSVGK
jgi:hypothetical protein